MKKFIARLASSVLAVLLFATQNPVLAQELASALTSETNKTSVSDFEPEIFEEILGKRSEYVKHFRTSDPSRSIAVVYPNQEHYKKGDKFAEIDNTLSEDGEEYKNTESPLQVKISKKFRNKKLISLKSGDHELSFSYIKKDKALKKTEIKANADESFKETTDEKALIKDDSEAVAIENFKTKAKKFANKKDELTSVSKCHSKAKYSSVDTGIGLNYALSGLGLKETIILNKLIENNSFDFEFQTDLKIEKDKTGNLNFLDQNNKIIFTMPKGSMWDSAGSYSNDVDYKFIKIDGGYKISVIPNSDWINDPNRLFPIFVDPSLTTDPALGGDTHEHIVLNSSTQTSSPSKNCIEAGGVYSTLMRYHTLPTFTHGEMITDAEFELKVPANFPGVTPAPIEGQTPQYIAVRPITSGTWDTSGAYPNNLVIGDVCDYFKINATDDWYSCDITKMAKQWYELNDPSAENKGFEIHSTERGNPNIVRFVSNTTSSGLDAPKLTLQYRNFIGEESYWSYTGHGAGLRGAGKVNNYAGTLSISENILSNSGARNPLSIINTYNNSHYNEHANTYVQEENFVGGYKHSSSTGKGFSLDFNQMLYEIQNSGDSKKMYADGFRYLYIDDDGTWHHFKIDGNNFTDEDGLGLTIKPLQGNANKLEMYDKKDNKLIFERKTTSPGPDNRCFALTNSVDYDQNEIEYEYTPQVNCGNNLKVSTIKEKLSKNSTGTDRITTINYGVNGRVSSIVDHDGKTVTFVYDGNQRLTEIQYPDENGTLSTFYDYDLENRLKEIRTDAGKGSSVKYTYISNNLGNSDFFKVESVTEYAGQNQAPLALEEGYKVIFNYEMNQTEITCKSKDESISHKEIWQFDHDGRVTCIMDEKGEMLTQQYMNELEKADIANKKNAFKVRHANDTGKYVKNLLTNGAATATLNNGMGDWTTSGGVSVVNEDVANIGTKSFKVQQNIGSPVIVSAGQNISIPSAGKYTLSAFVKIDKEISGGNGAFLQVGNEIIEDIFEMRDWRRISVTVDVQSPTTITCSFGLKNSNGIAYFDCLQLEEGEAVNDYNIVEDSSFDGIGSHWTYNNNNEIGIGDGMTLDGRLQITGKPNLEKGAYQDILIHKINTTLAVRCQAQGAAVPNPDPSISNPKPERYYIGCELTFESGASVLEKIPFNPYVSSVQNVYGSIDTRRIREGVKLLSIRIQPRFDNNCNTVYFDNVQVCIDDHGTSCEYEDGYIKKTVSNTGDTTEIERNTDKEITQAKSLNNLNRSEYNPAPNNRQLKSNSTALDKHRSIHNNFFYDTFGNLVKTIIKGCCGCQRFIETESKYTDSGNYLEWTKDSRGNKTEFEYDNENNGLLKKITTPNSSETEYEYDEADRVTSVTKGNSQSNYTYSKGVLDTVSHLAGTTLNIVNVAYNFVRNAFGQIEQTKVGDPNAPANYHALLTNVYNSGTKLLESTTYANNQSVNYEYDECGILKRKIYLKSVQNSVCDYTYDNKNRLIRINDNELETKFERDEFGRIAFIRRSDGVKKDYYYTKNNLIDKKRFRWNGIDQSTYNAYLPGNRLKGSTVKTNGIDFCSDYNNFDHLGRIKHLAMGSSANSNGGLIKHWNYVDVDNNKTTTLIQELTYKLRQNGNYSQNSDLKFGYEYDTMGNISIVKENDVPKIEYFYDAQNQLKRENNGYFNATVVYEYDFGGNILEKKSYALTLGNVDSDLSSLTPTTVNYSYTQPSPTNSLNDWKDILWSYNNQPITYDNIGNPITYRDGWNFEWNCGKRLGKANNSCYNVEYEYSDSGIRTQKIVTDNGVTKTTDFVTDGIQVLAQKTGNDTIVWQMDGNGSVLGFLHNGTQYYYLKNVQEDIVAIADATGTKIVDYVYDSWGKLISISDNSGVNIGEINPLRYRGYYFDTETGLYYLNARYYDPETGRFINADETLDGGLNLYSYCYNNPVNMIDPDGMLAFPGQIHGWILKRIVSENSSLSKERWVKGLDPFGLGRGRVDLVDLGKDKKDSNRGAIYELKPESWPTESAEAQLANYTKGKFANGDLDYMNDNIHIGNNAGGHTLSGSFSQDIYDINYNYTSNGIITYTYNVNKHRMQEQLKAAGKAFTEAALAVALAGLAAAALAAGLPAPAFA